MTLQLESRPLGWWLGKVTCGPCVGTGPGVCGRAVSHHCVWMCVAIDAWGCGVGGRVTGNGVGTCVGPSGGRCKGGATGANRGGTRWLVVDGAVIDVGIEEARPGNSVDPTEGDPADGGPTKVGPTGSGAFGDPSDGGVVGEDLGMVVVKIGGVGGTGVDGIEINKVAGGRFLVGGVGADIFNPPPDLVDILCTDSLCIFKYELSSF